MRAIWENYSGWFHHRSTTELYDVAPDELNADFVDLAGADRVVARAEQQLAAGRPVHAIHLAEAVVHADPGHAGARAVLKAAHEDLLAASTNFWESAWLTKKIGDYDMTARATFDFTGTEALITGGTSGIGHATATLFRDAGATVTVTGTKAGPGDYDTDLTGMTYRRLVLTDTSSIDELVSATSTLDVLVNNAGANFPGGLNEAEPDGFEASVALNLTAPYRLTVGLRKALAASTAPGGASVVFLSSLSALRAVTMVPGYGAAKAGIASPHAQPRGEVGAAQHPGQRGGARRDRHPDDRARPDGTGDHRRRTRPNSPGPPGNPRRGRVDDRVPVHRAEFLHQRRAVHRRRRVHQPVNEDIT